MWLSMKIMKSTVIASWDFLVSKRNTKKSKHRHRRQAKLKAQRFRRRALPYGLVMKCLRRPKNMPPRLVEPEKPPRWRWKQRKVGFAAVISSIGIKSLTINKFCYGNHDFLALPWLVNSFSDREFHAKNIKSCLSCAAVLRGMYDVHHAGCTKDPKTMVLIWDTGASAGLTPFRSDFIDYVEVDFEIRDVTKANKVAGIGTTLHKFVNDKGGVIYLPMVAYHLPNTDVRLFSPQVYHQLHGGHSTVDGDNVKMIPQGRGSTITIPIENGSSNLPCVYNLFVNDKVKKIYASKMRSGLKASRLFPALDFFGEMPLTMSKSSKQQALNLVLQCVGAVENENLTAPQRELLLWHWKLGIGMQRIQSMMQDQHYEDHLGRTECHPPIIKSKYPSTSSCKIPLCQSCLLARSRRRSPNVKRSQVNEDSEELSVEISLKWEILCLRISLSVALLVVFLQVMVGKGQIAVTMVVQFTMMQHLALFGLRTRCPWEQVRLLWAKSVLSSGCMIQPILPLSTSMGIMASLRLISTNKSVQRRVNRSLSLGLVHNIKMLRLNELFKQ